MCFYTLMAGRSNPKRPERCILHKASIEKRRLEGTRRNLKTTELLKSFVFSHMDGQPAQPEQTPNGVFGAGLALNTHMFRGIPNKSYTY